MKDYYETLKYEDKEYKLVFNINVMQDLQEKYGTFDKWTSLVVPEGEGAEPSVRAVIDVYTAMLNEGIDIENEANETKIKPFTTRQVGRVITAIGLEKAVEVMSSVVSGSTEGGRDSKNE